MRNTKIRVNYNGFSSKNLGVLVSPFEEFKRLVSGNQYPTSKEIIPLGVVSTVENMVKTILDLGGLDMWREDLWEQTIRWGVKSLEVEEDLEEHYGMV